MEILPGLSNGNRVYNLEEKLQMTDKNSIGGSV